MKYLKDFTNFNESIKVPIKKGDTIYGGRFKNRKTIVKKISEDEHGEPLVNDKPLLKYKLKKFENWQDSEKLNDLDDKTGLFSDGSFNPKKMLLKTNDIWVMDEIVIKTDEEFGPDPDIRSFYDVTIPEWVKSHYNKDLTFEGENFEKIEEFYENRITEFLNEKGLKNPRLVCIYYVLAHTPEAQDSRDTRFYFGYDVEKKNEESIEEHFTLFQFNHYKWEPANIKNTKMIDITNVNDSNKLNSLDERGSYNNVACYHAVGRFKNFKLNPPYNNLSEYFGKGAGNIVIFEA